MSDRDGVIITGGARRVGAALARHFAKHGYDIALHFRNSGGEALMLKNELEALGVACILFEHDLEDIAGIEPMMARIQEALPHCTALINNASVFERAPLMETDEALFDRQMGVNLKAPFFLTQAFARHFKTGSVVNMLDTEITQMQGSHFAYLLSKKALAAFTQMAARELGPQVRVNGVCPGCLIPVNPKDTSYEDKMVTLTPLRSHPSLEELCETVRWLAEQQHITGQIMFVDGGMHVL